jgi:DNA mismatch endonuclease, patch repair protein
MVWITTPTTTRRMRRVRPVDTKPEIAVRKVAHELGFRFRLHRRDLPGNPDLVFPKLRAIVLVHGCFWHHHARCRRGTMPKRNVDLWRTKFARNVLRDAVVWRQLREAGWRVLVVWECETADRGALRVKLRSFLSKGDRP